MVWLSVRERPRKARRAASMLLVAGLTALGIATWMTVSASAAPGPTVTTFTLNAASPTNASSVSWKLVFSSSVTGVAASNFQLVQGGTSGAGSISVSGGGTTWIVSANTGSGSGTLGLKLASAGSIKDGSNHALQGAPYTGPAFTIDKTKPTVLSINRQTGAANPTNQTSLPFTVTFSEPVKNVAVGNFAVAKSNVTGTPAIGTPVASGGSPSATWTVTLNAAGDVGANNGSVGLNLSSIGSIQDVVGNALAGTHASDQSYNFDTTKPAAPKILAAPPSPFASTSAIFAFVGPDAAMYLCKLDTGAFAPCFLVQAYTGLGQGVHTFQVEAVDAAGNVSATAATWTWRVDTVAPTVAFVNKPSNPDTNRSPQFTFSASDPGGSGVAFIQCKLDSGGWQTCTSPRNLPNLALASHTFSIRATDNAGNQSAALSYTWVIQASGGGSPYTICLPDNPCTLPTLYPGGTATKIDLTFKSTNVGNGGSGVNGTQVSHMTVSISSVTGPNITSVTPCSSVDGVDFKLTQIPAGVFPFYIQAGSSVTLSSIVGVNNLPTIQLVDRPTVNQFGCENATVHLTFTGTP